VGLIIIGSTDSDLRPVALGFLLPFLLGLGLFDAEARGIEAAALAIGHPEVTGFIACFGGARGTSGKEQTEDNKAQPSHDFPPWGINIVFFILEGRAENGEKLRKMTCGYFTYRRFK
jgi:hypothetical protein